MFSQVSIVNNALVEIGEGTITSMDQNTRAARVATRVWEQVLLSTLRQYRWNSARRRASLAPDTTAPEFGYAYRFLMPSDCVQIIGTYDPTAPKANYTSSQYSHVVEGRYILSDENPLLISYIAAPSDLAQIDPSLAEVLSLNLATRLAYDLSTGVDRIPQIASKFKEAVRQARFSNAIESTPEVVVASEWVDSRHSMAAFGYRNDNSI